MSENKRIVELGPNVYSEAFSDQIHVSWNPLTDDAEIRFFSSRFLKVGDTYTDKIGADVNLHISKSDLMLQSFDIGGRTITGQDIDIFVRLLYDKLYNETIDVEDESPTEEQ